MAKSIISKSEQDALTRLETDAPHSLLGMHPLGGKKGGVVVRAFIPNANSVRIEPVFEKDKPVIELKRIQDDGLFEGVTKACDSVYAYDLVISFPDGVEHRTRDPYSFLPTFSDQDVFLFNEGRELQLFDKLGSHYRVIDGVAGASFAVWAPNARRVSVVGDFNQWDGRCHMMRKLGASGIWEIFIPGVGRGAHYKFEVLDAHGGTGLKTDPFGTFFEVPPKNAAIVWPTSEFDWTDEKWLASRNAGNPLNKPYSIYEIHAGSWRRKSEYEAFGYRELAGRLIEYLRETGFTHVEFLPVAEHAFYPSWGYQVTGFYAPTSRYGTPEDFQYLVNELHNAGFGVIIDWVPAHFPKDDWALAQFDGTALYEHEDPRQGAHQDWGTLIFNFGRHEVRNFLIANALFWCARYHVDGLRVDAVASMLYLDYSRKEGEWVPNKYGGRENLEAVEFLKEFNHVVQTEFPGVVTIAEESTAWPQVSRPPYVGGLGFTFKWNMGWMHDTLNYFKLDPVYRKYHQNQLTFAMLYHYQENFILPLSHDEVVHGKASLIGRMPGDDWQRFANLRALLAYQWFFPGKKLLFMGGEFGQGGEWDCDSELAWGLLHEGPFHRGLQRLVGDMNRIYASHPEFYESDFDARGFQWIDCSDSEQSVLSFVRRNQSAGGDSVVIMNLTPELRDGYRIGLTRDGFWREILNTDSAIYGGGDQGNLGGKQAERIENHGQPYSADFRLPPLSVSVFKHEPSGDGQ